MKKSPQIPARIPRPLARGHANGHARHRGHIERRALVVDFRDWPFGEVDRRKRDAILRQLLATLADQLHRREVQRNDGMRTAASNEEPPDCQAVRVEMRWMSNRKGQAEWHQCIWYECEDGSSFTSCVPVSQLL